MQVALDEPPRKEHLEPPLEQATIVERARHPEDLRAVGRGCDRRRLAGRAEEHRLETDARTTRGERFAEVPRRRAAERLEVERLSSGDGARCDPVFEGMRRVGVLELEQQMDPERLRQAWRLDERRQP